MTNGELLRLYETLDKLIQNHDYKFIVRIGYLLAKNRAAIRDDAAMIYTARQNIMLENGELKENGDIIIPGDKVQEVQKQIDELMKVDVNVVISPINIYEFEESLSLEEIEGLMPILEEPLMTGPAIE